MYVFSLLPFYSISNSHIKIKNIGKGIQHIQISSFLTRSGLHCDTINLGYQLFGCSLGTAPIVVVNHALTGNSQVTGESGWWNEAIGEGKVIDTCRYTIIAFNVPDR